MPTSSDWRSSVEATVELSGEHGVGDREAAGLGASAKVLGDDVVVDQPARAGAGHQLLDGPGDRPEIAADRLDQRPGGVVGDPSAVTAGLVGSELGPLPGLRDRRGLDLGDLQLAQRVDQRRRASTSW